MPGTNGGIRAGKQGAGVSKTYMMKLMRLGDRVWSLKEEDGSEKFYW